MLFVDDEFDLTSSLVNGLAADAYGRLYRPSGRPKRFS